MKHKYVISALIINLFIAIVISLVTLMINQNYKIKILTDKIVKLNKIKSEHEKRSPKMDLIKADAAKSRNRDEESRINEAEFMDYNSRKIEF